MQISFQGMIWSLASVIVALGVLPTASADTTYSIQREKSADFKVDPASVSEGKIQIFFELSDPNGVPTAKDDVFNGTKGKSKSVKKFSAFDIQKPRNENDSLYVSVTKAAYLLHIPTLAFTKEWACSLDALKIQEPNLPMRSISTTVPGACGFRADPVGYAPGFDFTMDWKDDALGSDHAAPESTLNFDLELGRPTFSTIQNSFNFTPVIFGTTNLVKRSTVVNHYYTQWEQTLVVSYSYTAFYLLPPDAIGGPDLFRQTLFDQLPRTVSNLDAAGAGAL